MWRGAVAAHCLLTHGVRARRKKTAAKSPHSLSDAALLQQLSAVGDANAASLSKQLQERVEEISKLARASGVAAAAEKKADSAVKSEPAAAEPANGSKAGDKRKRGSGAAAAAAAVAAAEPKSPARKAASGEARAAVLSSSKKRKMWTEAEENNLRAGVNRYGVGQWAKIADNFEFNERSSIDLKDKWRNMNKNV